MKCAWLEKLSACKNKNIYRQLHQSVIFTKYTSA